MDQDPTPPAELLYTGEGSAADIGALDLTTWDDVEISDTRRVGDTQYTRGVIRGTSQERVWAEFDFGEGLRNTEEVTNSHELSPRGVGQVWERLTGPDAPTDVERQALYVDTVVLGERAEELKTMHLHEQELQPAAEPEPPLAEAEGPDLDDDFDMDM